MGCFVVASYLARFHSVYGLLLAKSSSIRFPRGGKSH
ncbi:hypothetical protein ATK86_5375 [Nocardia fluminea]|uniref:Uncharacterized protein n=1 Tax=Nocardia fluminea TaxID=134984 RepID=A0A2N3VH53_9NOCA|nr:hypothetical protein ATK86_5375 [Nocardia fluminea]